MPTFKKYKFNDFVDINPLVKLKNGEEYSFIEMADLNDGQRYAYPSIERSLTGGARFEEGDTLFARITPCLENGKICQAKRLKDGKGFGSTEFLVFRGKENVSDSNFVFYLSRWDEVRRFAELHMVGTSGRQRVPKDVFENLELNLPNLPTQTRIASILSSLDDKIELNRRTNHTLEQIAQTLFKKNFVDEIDPENLPEGWRITSLNEFMDFEGGMQPPASEFIDSPAQGYIRLIQIRDYESDSNMTYVPIKNNLRFCNKKDVMIARYGASVARVCFGLDGAYNVALVRVKPHKPHYLEFLRTYLKSNDCQEKIINMSFRSVQAGFNKDDFKSIMIPVPNDENLFISYEKQVSILIDKMLQNKEQNKALTKTRDSLLPKLISGEIEVNVAENELAVS